MSYTQFFEAVAFAEMDTETRDLLPPIQGLSLFNLDGNELEILRNGAWHTVPLFRGQRHDGDVLTWKQAHDIWVPASDVNVIGTLSGQRAFFLQDHAKALEVRRTWSTLVATVTGTGGMTPYGDHAHTSTTSYKVVIDGAGNEEVATFKWSGDGGATYTQTLVSIQAGTARIHLQSNMYVLFTAGAYEVGDQWTWTAIATGSQLYDLKVDTTSSSVSIGNTLYIANDSDFFLHIDPLLTQPQISFAPGDGISYNRTSDTMYLTAGATVAAIDPTGVQLDSLRIYGSSTTALEVKRVYSDTGGTHPVSTGSMDAVGVHTLAGAVNKAYTITIDSPGSTAWLTATFSWSDGTSSGALVPVHSGTAQQVLTPILLSNGVYVLFSRGNYQNAETWTVTAIAASNQSISLRSTTSPSAGNISTYMTGASGVGTTMYVASPTASMGIIIPAAQTGGGLTWSYGQSLFVTFATGLLSYNDGGQDRFKIDPDFVSGTGGTYIIDHPIVLNEVSGVSAPAANAAKLYAKDNAAETHPYWRNTTAEYAIGLVGLIDHGALVGLADDDHTQYTLKATLTTKGDIYAATAASTPARLAVGADDTILMADTAAATGLKWVASASPSAVGTAAATGTSDTFTRGDHVHAHEAAHLAHDTLWDAKGDLVGGTGADTAAKLAVGADDTILMADAAAATGMKWVAATTAPASLGTTTNGGVADTFARGDHVHIGGLLVDGSGGTTRVLAASSSPHVSVTGDLDVSAHGAFGADGTVGTAQGLLVQESSTQAADYKGVYNASTITLASSGAGRSYFGYDNIGGVTGAFVVDAWTAQRDYYEWNVASTVTAFTGLQQLLYVGSLFGSTTAAVATTLLGLDVRTIVNPVVNGASQTHPTVKAGYFNLNHASSSSIGFTSTITDARGLHVDIDMATSSRQRITTLVGVDIDMGGLTTGTIATGIGLRIIAPGAATITTQWGIYSDSVTQYNWLEGRTQIGATTSLTSPTMAATSPRLAVVETSIPAAGGESTTPVLRLRSTATGSDPTLDIYHARNTTTDATVTTLGLYTIPATTTVYIEAHVTARRTGGVAGTAEDGAAYVRMATFKNVAGVATQIGATTAVHTNEDVAGYDVTFDVNAATARLRVTGVANTNITWHGELRVRQVGS